MDFEVFQVNEDGTRFEVTVEKLNDALSPRNVLILVDHVRRKIYNYNGSESGIRVRFVGARMAAGPIRGELGLSYTIASVDEGEETQEFRDVVKNIGCQGNPLVTKMFEKASAQKAGPEQRKQSVQPLPLSVDDVNPATTGRREPPRAAKLGASVGVEALTKTEIPKESAITSIIKEFGDTPSGYDLEAVIVKDAVYKYLQVQTSVFGKEVEQTRLERVNDLDGIFTLDGQIKLNVKNGSVSGIQVLSKVKGSASKKSKSQPKEGQQPNVL